jgi:hypothetical protein
MMSGKHGRESEKITAAVSRRRHFAEFFTLGFPLLCQRDGHFNNARSPRHVAFCYFNIERAAGLRLHGALIGFD